MKQLNSGTSILPRDPRSSVGMPRGEHGCATSKNSEGDDLGQQVGPTALSELSPQQRRAHRAKIGVRARAILDQFWRDNDTPDAIQAVEIEGWMDVLEVCSHSQIRLAWAAYQKEGPRTQSGKLCKPDAGALYRIAMRENRPTTGNLTDFWAEKIRGDGFVPAIAVSIQLAGELLAGELVSEADLKKHGIQF